MDTRVSVFTLIDYKDFHNEEKSLNEALNIVRDIPSITLLNYISGFNVNLYLRENFEHSGKIQAYLLYSILKKAPNSLTERWKEVLQWSKNEGHAPVIIWNYSNLLFYDLIFKRFNRLPWRDLTMNEANKFFNAYLIINSITNKRIKIEETELLDASQNNNIEDITLPSFIYQKDYASTTDFSNQVTRGITFFRYLEAHRKYKSVVNEYYQSKHIPGYLRLFKNLLVIFSELQIAGDLNERNQQVNLEKHVLVGDIDLSFINTLCINSSIKEYIEDKSFGQLRERFLYKSGQYTFFVLDVNFLIDNFYKAQIFSFNGFLKSKKIKDEFLSIKAKDFMEGIYLPQLINRCFYESFKYLGIDCINSKGEELCDVYIREGNKICIIEFKDILLNADAKNSGDKNILYLELDKKFIENQKKKPKGVTQLVNAVNDIESYGVLFDRECPNINLEIYPVILYTDFSFGIEGVNKMFKEKFSGKLENKVFSKLQINELTFINLNFFELHEEYIANKHLNIFTMLREYHLHIQNPNYHLTPFESFSRFYMDKNISFDLGEPDHYKQMIHDISKS